MRSEHMVVIGDCRHMREIRPSSVQLIITNPPVFFCRCSFSNSGLPQDFNSYVKELKSVFRECFRVLQSGRYICINFRGPDHDAFPPAQFLISLKQAGFDYVDDIIWVKRPVKGAMQLNSPESNVEHTLIFRKGRAKHILTAKLKSWALSEESNFASDTGLWISDTALSAEGISLRLIESLIAMYTFEGESVLDPFLGDGTVSRAAALLNRRSIGYENNPFNIRIIKRKSGIPDSRLKVVFQGEGRLT